MVRTDPQNYGVSTDHQDTYEVPTASHGVSTDQHKTQGSLPTTSGLYRTLRITQGSLLVTSRLYNNTVCVYDREVFYKQNGRMKLDFKRLENLTQKRSIQI